MTEARWLFFAIVVMTSVAMWTHKVVIDHHSDRLKSLERLFEVLHPELKP